MSGEPQWHHHHNGDHQIVFCDGIDPEDLEFAETEVCEEWYGLACDGWLPLKQPPRMRCHYHLAFGDVVVENPEQLVLVSHLEAVPDVSHFDAALEPVRSWMESRNPDVV